MTGADCAERKILLSLLSGHLEGICTCACRNAMNWASWDVPVYLPTNSWLFISALKLLRRAKFWPCKLLWNQKNCYIWGKRIANFFIQTRKYSITVDLAENLEERALADHWQIHQYFLQSSFALCITASIFTSSL